MPISALTCITFTSLGTDRRNSPNCRPFDNRWTERVPSSSTCRLCATRAATRRSGPSSGRLRLRAAMRTRFSRCCAYRGEAGTTAHRSAPLLQGRYGARQFSRAGGAGECALRLCGGVSQEVHHNLSPQKTIAESRVDCPHSSSRTAARVSTALDHKLHGLVFSPYPATPFSPM